MQLCERLGAVMLVNRHTRVNLGTTWMLAFCMPAENHMPTAFTSSPLMILRIIESLGGSMNLTTNVTPFAGFSLTQINSWVRCWKYSLRRLHNYSNSISVSFCSTVAPSRRRACPTADDDNLSPVAECRCK